MQQWHQIKFFFSCSLEHWGGRQQRGLQFQFDKKTNLTLLSENFFYISTVWIEKNDAVDATKYEKIPETG